MSDRETVGLVLRGKNITWADAAARFGAIDLEGPSEPRKPTIPPGHFYYEYLYRKQSSDAIRASDEADLSDAMSWLPVGNSSTITAIAHWLGCGLQKTLKFLRENGFIEHRVTYDHNGHEVAYDPSRYVTYWRKPVPVNGKS